MELKFEQLRSEISLHESNDWARELGYEPLFTASSQAKVMIVGQAPGIRAQTSRKPWNDPSGVRLREWLNLAPEVFYDEKKVALVPMDFYYPGKGRSGDLPPRKDFAPLWHPKVMSLMSDLQLIILVGQYSQAYYLGKNSKSNLSANVRNFQDYLPRYFPVPHPSPRNLLWLKKNPWFEAEVVGQLRASVASLVV